MTAAVTERMPAIYLSHGAPPLADDPVWPGQLAAWAATLPRPKAGAARVGHPGCAPERARQGCAAQTRQEGATFFRHFP